MSGRLYRIVDRERPHPIAMPKPLDFTMADEGAIDPSVALECPEWSLYCLDADNYDGIFVECPPEIDLTRFPFYYQAQFQHAVRVLRVPAAEVERLAEQAPLDPSSLILVYSMGRCGSTLVSRAFGEAEATYSLSEPDAFTQLRHWRSEGKLDDAEINRLLKIITRLQITPGRLRGNHHFALKFRSEVTEMFPFFYEAFPEAKLIYLYRSAAPWARSFLRVWSGSDPMEPVPKENLGRHWGGLLSDWPEVRRVDIMAARWVVALRQCLEMQRRGIPLFIVRYEELAAAPLPILRQMFDYCGVSLAPGGDLEKILAVDSQEGSSFSRAALQERARTITPEHLEAVRTAIPQIDPILSADYVISGSVGL